MIELHEELREGSTQVAARMSLAGRPPIEGASVVTQSRVMNLNVFSTTAAAGRVQMLLHVCVSSRIYIVHGCILLSALWVIGVGKVMDQSRVVVTDAG